MKTYQIILTALILFAFSAPPAEVQLQYRFNVGDEYLWVQDTKQTIKQSIMSMDQNSKNSYESEFLLKVVEVTSSGAKLEAKFTKLRNESVTPMGNNLMDSNGPQDKMENKIFQSMLNKPFYIFMKSTGNIEKIEGASNLWSGFKDLGLEEDKRNVIQESLEMLLGESSLKSSFQTAFVPYPEKKIKEGERWTVSQDVTMNFPMSIKNTWNLVSVSSGEANLTADGIFTTTDKEKAFNLPGGMKAKSDLNGKQAVKSLVNSKTGWPSKQSMIVELKGTMTLLAGGMIPQDMEVPMEILSETSYVITRK